MKIVMLCLCRAPPTEESSVIDVKKVLEDYSWNMFKSTMGACAKTFLRRRDFIVEVPLNYYHTEDVSQTFVRREIPIRSPSGQSEKISELKSEFRNNTDTNQTFRFRFERTRKAAINVTFQKGFTMGARANFSLGLPVTGDNACSEMNMSLQVTNSEGECFEDTLVLEATSDLAVEKKHTYITGVSLKQIEIAYDFTVETILRMPNNKAPVSIKKRKGGDIIASFYIRNLKDVFEGISSAEIIDDTPTGNTNKQYAVKFVTTGIVEGAQLANQNIILDSQKIDSVEKSTSTIDIPQNVVRPSKLGTIISVKDTEESVSMRMSCASSSISGDKIQDPQTATERRSSFKRFSQFGENYTSLTTGSPETKILHTPKIPTIIKTSPSTPRASPPVSTYNEEIVRKDQTLAPKRPGVRAKSPLRVNALASFQGTSPHTVRPKLSKMTSV